MATRTTSFEFGEISGTRIECKKCSTAVTIPFEAFRRIPGGCPVCNDDWSDFDQEGVVRAAHESLMAFKRWANGSLNVPFVMRIEIESRDSDEQ
jgi:hypothetical protein